MKTQLASILLCVGAALLAGCSTVESRIGSHRASYDTWPPAVQQQVRAGQVNIGFTPEQVRVALGDPDYVFTRAAPTGSFEVWSYRDREPRFSFGIGVGGGSFHRGSGYSTGVGLSTTTGGYPGERLRVIFDQYGRVNSIEEVRRGR